MTDEPQKPTEPVATDPYATSSKPFVPPPAASTQTFYPDELGGTMIGPYKLLQLLGKGGMGAVWMAEQTEPVQRRVAVKIIKPGYGGSQVLARFEAERQALAMMDHPNIAKVLDAGATADGKPYVVMELVKGIPFTKYCDQEHLTPAERVALFIPVCKAVQHAHQKGIIHRDLKPSNVLIALYDGKPIPKVIDFGIAKATHQKLTERTMFTEVGQIVGTLEYMAPEQAELNNLDIDTRADIYSLGVMLYELLTGSPPFSAKELQSNAFMEMLRLIKEVEPSKPSTRLSKSDDLPAIAAKRKLEPKKLSRLVQGDLDWIVMKCLEKDRGRRYESANHLGEELTRYLADQPVQAGPPSVGYLAKKFLRRNKGAAIATAVGLVLVVVFIGLVIYTRLSTHATGLVAALLVADIEQVPPKIDELGPVSRWWADTLLREARSDRDENRQLRASLALLPVDRAQVEYLYERLLQATPHDFPVIRDALKPYEAELVDRLWADFDKSQPGDNPHRLRAAAALASYDPHSPRWDRAGVQVARDIVSVNPVYLGRWSEAFRPIKARLIAPLSDLFRERDPDRSAERALATNLLADYAADEPQVLAKLLLDADERQFIVLFPKLQAHGDRVLPLLTDEIDRKLPAGATQEDRDRLPRRQANAAGALLRMNHATKVWPLLTHSPDPTLRSYLIHRLGPLGADVAEIVTHLDKEQDVSIRRALILSLGEFSDDHWPPEVKKSLVAKMQATFATAADPGIHGASEWLLRKWSEEPWLQKNHEAWIGDSAERKKRQANIESPSGDQKAWPQWYVTGQGQTMVVIPGPVVFDMGSPVDEPRRSLKEVQHRKRISRTFAIASKPITVAQYLAFRKPQSEDEAAFFKERAPTDDCPMRGSWFMAAEYCNWLSDREGLPRCYETDAKGNVTKPAKNHLELTGYRLPTESEWEYACRAGNVTSRYFYGDAVELLGHYASFSQNADERTWPVGTKKPNDLGLFDMHGNVWTWCQTELRTYPKAKPGETFEDKDDDVPFDAAKPRVLRGGSFSHLPSSLRCAYRNWEVPTERYITYGIRPARTVR